MKVSERTKHVETVLVLVLALGIIYWITEQPYFLLGAGILGAIGLFIPFLARIIHDAWMKLAHMLGFVMSKVLLSVMFIIIVVPMSVFSKLFRSKNGIKLESGAESYFIVRDYTYDKESIENVW